MALQASLSWETFEQYAFWQVSVNVGTLKTAFFFNHLAATNVIGFSETLSLGGKSLSLAEKFLSLGKSY